jgi:deoxyribodipyrimidine photo-lyase
MDRLSILWFRRDLRLADHPALLRAIERAGGEGGRLLPLFIWERRLYAGPRSSANRSWYLRESLTELAGALAARGSRLLELEGEPDVVLADLVATLRAAGEVTLVATADHTPYANARDRRVDAAMAQLGVAFERIGGPSIVEPGELQTGSGGAYRVFTPYHRAWLARITDVLPPLATPERLPPPPAIAFERHRPDRAAIKAASEPSARMELLPTPGERAARAAADAWLAGGGAIDRYPERRDLLADTTGTSRLSAALHLGLLSPRELATRLLPLHEGSARGSWLRQLAWRDFYTEVLAASPHAASGAWRPEYDAIEWEDDETAFAAWCEGRTGYPVVDAAMRELRESGLMHNRARMIVASFLVKDLLIDWRKGETHFLRHLVDGDLAANNGGWQWSAGSGTDAQPYFRILNPVRQSERFDPQGAYLRRWLPELAALPDVALHAPWEHPDALEAAGIELGRDYPAPIIDHAVARARTLERFGRALKRSAER